MASETTLSSLGTWCYTLWAEFSVSHFYNIACTGKELKRELCTFSVQYPALTTTWKLML